MKSIMQVPFVDISRFISTKKSEILQNIEKTLSSGQLINNVHTQEAEKILSHYLKDSEVSLVGSCTEALTLSLLAAGVKANDEVILPAYSFVATLNAVKVIGAKPVFIDTGLNGSGYDFKKLKNILENKEHSIKAIVIVHLFGHFSLMSELYELCSSRKIALIEDCAQWFSNELDEFKLENHFRCYSFDPTKNFHSIGTLGAVATSSKAQHFKINNLRSHGISTKENLTIYSGCGMNSRPNELNSLFLKLTLQDHAARELRRQDIVQQYIDFCKINKVEYIKPTSSEKKSTWNKFIVLIENSKNFFGEDVQQQVQFKKHYDYLLPELEGLKDLAHFPSAQRLKLKSLTLPLFAEMTQQEVDQTLSVLKKNL